MSWTLPTDFPAQPAPPKDVLDVAARKGTLGQIDRRPQYQGPNWSTPEKLLETVNVQGNHIRGVQADVGRVQHDLYNLKLRNAIVVAVITGVLARAPEIVSFLSKFF